MIGYLEFDGLLYDRAGEPARPLPKTKQVPVEFLEFVKSAPVRSGTCCCGDDMDRHADPMSCGHTPVDQWDYSLALWLEQIEKENANAV